MNSLNVLFNVRRALECRTISKIITADGKDVPKRKTFEQRITLISSDNTVSITDLKNAQTLSLRRDLKLVKIQDEDSKSRRPIYRLMTSAEYLKEDLEKRKQKQSARKDSSVKGEKLLTMSTKIGEHDLMTNIKKMQKFLQKHYEVRVVISGDGTESASQTEKIFSVIERNLKSLGKILQKRNKGSSLKFQLQPTSSATQSIDKESTSPDNGNDKGPL